MESSGIVVFIIIVLAVIVFIIYMSSPRRKYDKAVEKSTGLDRVRLIVRKNAIAFGNQLKKRGDDSASRFPIELPVMETHQALADVFYGMLNDTTKSWGNSSLFDELSDSISSDKEKELVVSSRMFGIAFGIVLEKAAKLANAEIKKATIKKFISSSEIEEIHKKEISKMAIAYLDLSTSDTKTTWASLEKMTYELMGAKITREKDDIADPIIIMPLKTALSYAYGKTTLKDLTIEKLEKEGLIKADNNPITCEKAKPMTSTENIATIFNQKWDSNYEK